MTALADDVADAHAQMLEVQDMARRSPKVLPAIKTAVQDLHGLLVEIEALADSISAASLAKRLWNGGDDEQKIANLRGRLKRQLQLLMGAASLKVSVHNANVLAELQREQQRAAQQQQFGFDKLNERLGEFIALVLNRSAAAGGAAQQGPTLTLDDLPEAGLSKLQEAARSRLQGSGAAEAQVRASRARLAASCTGGQVVRG